MYIVGELTPGLQVEFSGEGLWYRGEVLSAEGGVFVLFDDGEKLMGEELDRAWRRAAQEQQEQQEQEQEEREQQMEQEEQEQEQVEQEQVEPEQQEVVEEAEGLRLHLSQRNATGYNRGYKVPSALCPA